MTKNQWEQLIRDNEAAVLDGFREIHERTEDGSMYCTLYIQPDGKVYFDDEADCNSEPESAWNGTDLRLWQAQPWKMSDIFDDDQLAAGLDIEGLSAAADAAGVRVWDYAVDHYPDVITDFRAWYYNDCDNNTLINGETLDAIIDAAVRYN